MVVFMIQGLTHPTPSHIHALADMMQNGHLDSPPSKMSQEGRKEAFCEQEENAKSMRTALRSSAHLVLQEPLVSLAEASGRKVTRLLSGN